tara:strand:+ start:129 stop:965 length:837 start_codon:yes stop_codon:yes gene_type:complete
MINVYEFILIFIFLTFIYLWIKNSYTKEGFEIKKEDKYYKTCHQYQDIYDDFYGFMYDELFYQEEYYLSICDILLQYINHVYNNHLCIGIKHGGHLNELLKKNMKTESISRSQALVNICNYRYPDNIYSYIPSIETNPYTYDEHTFTHISLIDNELYYIENLQAALYNCSKWLTFKGYLFIQCYKTKNDLKKAFVKDGDSVSIRMKEIYTNHFKDYQNNDTFYFIEQLTYKKKKRVNRHSLYYHNFDTIIATGKQCGLYLDKNMPISNHENVLVFQKR